MRSAKKIVSLPEKLSTRLIGTDELNICEFPLASTGRAASQHQTTLVFEDDVHVEGSKQPVHRKLIVSASEAYGLPTPADSDVLLVLMHITNLRNGFTTPTVHFTRYELVQCLGWDTCGRSYRRIEESLTRWVNITLNYNRAWWDRDCHYQNKSFHILESVDLRGRGDHHDDGTSSFTWNPVIFASFQANQIKQLDLDVYFQLKSPAAKQAYRYLDKRFYKPKYLEFNLRTFACEHIGLSRNYDIGQLKRKLQPAIEELEGIGFLKKLPLSERYFKRQRDEWMIRLIRAGHEGVAELPTLSEEPSLEAELTSRGLHAATARELISQFSEERIREKISLLDWLEKKGGERKPENAAGYLVAAIRNDYRPPADFNVASPRPPIVETKRPAAVAVTPDTSSDQTRIDEARDYFRSLTPDEQFELETLAVEKGNRFRVDTYHRLKVNGGPLWESSRDLLIADLLETMPELAARKAVNSGV